jgi:hypothetical protein
MIKYIKQVTIEKPSIVSKINSSYQWRTWAAAWPRCDENADKQPDALSFHMRALNG